MSEVMIEAGVSTPCSIAVTHAPTYRTIELHHVIPVAWQLHTTVTGPGPFPGPDPDGRGMLWDDRGVWVCPTHHRNVHYWIVTLMHAIAAGAVDSSAAWLKLTASQRRLGEAKVAVLALSRYEAEAAGDGTLLGLTKQHEWGQV